MAGSDPPPGILAGYVLSVTAPPGTYIQPGDFYALLIRTMFQADRLNRARLAAGFPLLADMVTAYKDDPRGVQRLEAAVATGVWEYA